MGNDAGDMALKMARSILKKIWIRTPKLRKIKYRSEGSVYIFLPINGVGLGHLTRCLAIANQVKKKNPSAEIIFLTTSIALPIVHRAGFVCHHVTPAALAGDQIGQANWNSLFSKSIENIIELYKPKYFIFDGSFPYVGLRRVLHRYKNKIYFVWVRRGLNKASTKGDQLESYFTEFDKVISPGELMDKITDYKSEASDGKVANVNPVYLLEQDELLERDYAKRQLSIDIDQPCAYVQLGAGNINEVDDIQGRVIRGLQSQGLEVVVARSPIALGDSMSSEADRTIMDYPNSRYYNAFDIAVMAGGYNSVCEAVVYGIPTIFIPNLSTGSDDQLKRVNQVRHDGLYEVLSDFDEEVFSEMVKKVVGKNHDHSNKRMTFENGAKQAASIISSHKSH